MQYGTKHRGPPVNSKLAMELMGGPALWLALLGNNVISAQVHYQGLYLVSCKVPF